MRLPRIPRIRKQEIEDDDLWDISKEIEEVNDDIVEETEEAEYSEILLSEPDEEKKEGIKGKEYVLPEFYLSPDEKKSMEEETFGDSDNELREKSWEKRAKESLGDIEKTIDGGLLKKEEEEEIFEEESQSDKDETSDFLSSPEEIKGKIINREIVYETSGGYVVKVITKEGGRVQTSYYSVSKVDGIEQALDDLQKYKPVIEDSRIPVKVDNKTEGVEKSPESKDKKSFFDGILNKKQ